MKTRRRGRDRGDTMVELLVAVVIMGIAVVAVAGGVAVSIRMSDVHRKQAKAGAYIRDFAEAIENAVAASPSAYAPCAAAGAYDSHYALTDPAFTVVAPTPVRYWNGTAFGTVCGTDSGVQQLSLRIDSTDQRVTETLIIVIRRPCRSTLDFPLDSVCS